MRDFVLPGLALGCWVLGFVVSGMGGFVWVWGLSALGRFGCEDWEFKVFDLRVGDVGLTVLRFRTLKPKPCTCTTLIQRASVS